MAEGDWPAFYQGQPQKDGIYHSFEWASLYVVLGKEPGHIPSTVIVLQLHNLLDSLPNMLCSQTLEKQYSVRGVLGPGGGRAGLPCGDAMGCHTEDIDSSI